MVTAPTTIGGGPSPTVLSDRWALRVPGTPVSLRASRRSILVTLALFALAGAVFLWSLTLGDPHLGLTDILQLLAGGGDPDLRPTLFRYRLGPGLTALLAGAALGMAGLLLQRLTRNPLASPDIIGVTNGASAGAAFMIIVLDRLGPPVSVAALVGGFGAATVVHLLSYRRGQASGYRLVLIGVGMASLLGALTAYLTSRATLDQATRTVTFTIGSLDNANWDEARSLGWGLAILVPLALLLARPLRILELGEDTAVGMGVRGGRVRLAVLAVGAALAALASAACGPIAFVALLSPHIARGLTRDRSIGLLPSAAVGSSMVVGANVIAQHVLPTALPAGVVTALIGGPFLLVLLARANRTGALG